MPWALVFAFASAGNSSAAKIAMMAMTTRSSMSVKPTRLSPERKFVCRSTSLPVAA